MAQAEWSWYDYLGSLCGYIYNDDVIKWNDFLRYWPFALLAIHRWPVNSPPRGPVPRKMFPFDDVIMIHDSGMASREQRTVALWNVRLSRISIPNLVHPLLIAHLFCFEILHRATTVVFYANFGNDLKNDMDATEERGFNEIWVEDDFGTTRDIIFTNQVLEIWNCFTVCRYVTAHVTSVGITDTTALIPYRKDQSLQLIWASVSRTFDIRVHDLQMCSSKLKRMWRCYRNNDNKDKLGAFAI